MELIKSSIYLISWSSYVGMFGSACIINKWTIYEPTTEEHLYWLITPTNSLQTSIVPGAFRIQFQNQKHICGFPVELSGGFWWASALRPTWRQKLLHFQLWHSTYIPPSITNLFEIASCRLLQYMRKNSEFRNGISYRQVKYLARYLKGMMISLNELLKNCSRIAKELLKNCSKILLSTCGTTDLAHKISIYNS